MIARLLAGIRLMADHSYIWFWSKLTVIPVTNGRSTMIWNYTFADKFAANILGGDPVSASLQKSIDERYSLTRDEAYARAKTNHTWRNQEVQLGLELPLRRPGVTAATTVWSTYSERLLTPERYKQMQQNDEQDRLTRERVESGIRERRSELGRP